MRLTMRWQRLAAVLAAIWICGLAPTSASNDSSLQRARELADLAWHGMQNRQPDSMIVPLLQQALQADPDSAWAHFLASQVAATASEADFHKAQALRLARWARQPEGRLIEAELESEIGSKVSVLRQLAKAYPGERRIRMALGKALLVADSADEALQELEKARRMDSGTACVYVYLAESSLRLGDLRSARLHYRSALARLHPQAQAENLWGGLAMTYLAHGNASLALNALQDYLPQSPRGGQPGRFSARDPGYGFTPQPSPHPSALRRHRSISRSLEEALQRLRSKKPL